MQVLNQYVAFVRAINVGGHACMSMSELQRTFVSAGALDVRTVIQSGNVLLHSPPKDSARIIQNVRGKLCRMIGDEPDVMLRTIRELEVLVRSDPFTNFDPKPDKKFYVAFLARQLRVQPTFPLRSRAEAMEAIAMRNREVFIVSHRKKNGFFGFPNNFIEAELGVPATTRNWWTVTKIAELAQREL